MNKPEPKRLCPTCDDRFSDICDFCYYYDFNPNKGGGYQELGYCRLHKEGKDPGDGCEKFICANVKPKEKIRWNHDNE